LIGKHTLVMRRRWQFTRGSHFSRQRARACGDAKLVTDKPVIGLTFQPRIRIADIKRPRVILKNVRRCTQERRDFLRNDCIRG
jgi:hypothetical protein